MGLTQLAARFGRERGGARGDSCRMEGEYGDSPHAAPPNPQQWALDAFQSGAMGGLPPGAAAAPPSAGEGGAYSPPAPQGDQALELLPRTQIQRLAAERIGQDCSPPIAKGSVTVDAADALQKAASIFVSYLTTCSHEAARVHQEERHQQKRQRTSAGMAGPDSVKTLTKHDVMTAVELMCPEILQQLRARPSVPHRASAAEPGVLFVRRGVRQGLRPRACQGSARGAESAAQESARGGRGRPGHGCRA